MLSGIPELLYRVVLLDKDSRRLAMFIAVMAAFIFFEMGYGSMNHSLGLVADSFHTTFDCLALCISLFTAIISKYKPKNGTFSYGYERLEVLLGFSNGVFLLFICIFLVLESVEHLLEDEVEPIENPEGVITVGVVGLVINFISVAFFQQQQHMRAETKYTKVDPAGSALARLVTDSACGLTVVLSTLLVSWGWHFADVLGSAFISILIVTRAFPLCKATAQVLLQTTPLSAKDTLDQALKEAAAVDGVLECKNEHFWTQSPGVFVGSLCVRVRGDANEQAVLAHIHNLFSRLVTHLTIQVEKDEW
jgi:zinc transporter 5/7